jgi:hypothetical protein
MAADQPDATYSGDAGQFDLSHLTRLTSLWLGLDISSIQQVQQPLQVSGLLPLQLLQLDASCRGCAVLPMLNVTALQQLKCLALSDCVESDDSLLSLNRLSSLADLRLVYKAVLGDVEGFGAWAQLSQLRSLQLTSLQRVGQPVDRGLGFRRMMQAVGTSTSLRHLRSGWTPACRCPRGRQCTRHAPEAVWVSDWFAAVGGSRSIGHCQSAAGGIRGLEVGGLAMWRLLHWHATCCSYSSCA